MRRRNRLTRMLQSLVFIILAVYAGLCLSIYLLQGRLVYYPTAALAATPRSVGLAYEDVTFRTRSGVRLHGWFIPAPGATQTLLFCHGNAGNISDRLESLLIFQRLGLDTFIFDYAGYGASKGKPSESQSYEDVAAGWAYLVDGRGVAPGRIVLFGRSLGGAVALFQALRSPPAGLIMESSFTSIPDMAAALYPILPVRYLARIRYDNLARVGKVGVPLLIAHSRDDELIPFAHAERLYRAATAPKTLLVMRGGHNDGFVVSGEAYVRGMARFLRSLPAPE